jgi:lipoprotein-anchoring transpeptidase ErfK/SrfK
MSKTHAVFVSKPFFLLFLLALLLGILYLAAFFRDMSGSPFKIRQIAAEVDFENANGSYVPSETSGTFNNESVPVPPEISDEQKQVLGETTGEKRIEVDLTNQRVYAFEGDRKVFDFLVSTGKWGRTPTGEFKIWTKIRYTKMSGGSKALGTYYYLPNVPFVMFFSNAEVAASRGFSLHGTYWHNNFGHPMSHGCVNMKTEEIEQLYYWATPVLPEGKTSTPATKDNPGTKVIIYGTAPQS